MTSWPFSSDILHPEICSLRFRWLPSDDRGFPNRLTHVVTLSPIRGTAPHWLSNPCFRCLRSNRYPWEIKNTVEANVCERMQMKRTYGLSPQTTNWYGVIFERDIFESSNWSPSLSFISTNGVPHPSLQLCFVRKSCCLTVPSYHINVEKCYVPGKILPQRDSLRRERGRDPGYLLSLVSSPCAGDTGLLDLLAASHQTLSVAHLKHPKLVLRQTRGSVCLQLQSHCCARVRKQSR